MDIITDTNFWYDLASGRIDVGKIPSDWVLCPTPINFIEIISKMTIDNFSDRKRALLEIQKYAVNFCPTTDTLIGIYFDVNDGKNEPSFSDWVDIFCSSSSLSDADALFKKDPIYSNVSIDTFWQHRLNVWHSFENDIVSNIKKFHPNYKRKRGGYNFVKKIDLSRKNHPVNIYINDPNLPQIVLTDMFFRATNSRSITDKFYDNFDVTHKALSDYIDIYKKYIIACVSEKPPQENDWADLEVFIYANGDNQKAIATSEKKWIKMAGDAKIKTQLIDLASYKI